MAKATAQAPRERIAIDDPRGRDWQEKANRSWSEALAAAPDDPESAYQRVPLPDFAELRPAHVTREVFGAFVVDRDRDVVHRIETARQECRIDAIANATFVHFGHEVDPYVDRHAACFVGG